MPRLSAVRRVLVATVGSRPGAAIASRVLPPVDRWVWRASRRQRTLSSLLSGTPIVLLSTTGTRTGRTRTVPLIGLDDGDDVVVVASSFTDSRDPAWLLNLRSTPQATLARAARSWPVVPVELDEGPERERLWAQAVATYPPWADYQRRSPRRFPVVRLVPER